ncbi:sporulation integral membrane protein YtvI [Paenibacillus melissococcoides]|uniref:Sporulation integral membrane protein YtvI n=1 Tax=Paenibacillus melissococcoides TaxID=2912268 RepID=A0ABN8U736_9BACL|nr:MULTISPECIES: sporulation integral membrane protein YtvI [Paenibacillus]MEB9895424.1 sporulation integral membrane protein YtvI [Bacillus cereus]CAH8246952.1 sporulation integral membrane protein YtvI [Paenibacillus melissococcoides]CAH8716300.1 sporulation integral membrane protein YtvI [Paenibacillus melissococcoides]CAH8717282.1 sporulation integral membrane protein YtvI [Paenibacillus melissococcoides]GIO76640.1 sporulation integral membrane protein YtvI [Paenibacillus dendritiformis]
MPLFNVTLVHRIFRGLWVTIVTVGTILLFYYGFPIIYPFLIAWLLAYMMNPLVRFLEQRWRFPRWTAVASSILLFGSIIAFAIFVFTTKIVSESWHIVGLVQEQIAEWKDWLNDYYHSPEFQALLTDLNATLTSIDLQSSLSKYTSTIATTGSALVAYLFNFIKATVLFLPKLAVITVIIMVATYLISRQWNSLAAASKQMVPERVRASLGVVMGDLQHAIFGYVKGHIILSSITALVFFLGLLVLGVEYAFTIAIIGGIVDLIPLIGIPAIVVPWAVFSFFEGDLFLGTGLLVLWPIILVTRHALEPKVYGSSIGLNPLMLLIFLFAGLHLFGVIGIFVGIIALVILTALQRAHVFRDVWRYIMTGSFFPAAPPAPK